MARPTFESVDDYIAAQPEATRSALKRVRATLRKALPKATEGISYQIPVYKIDGAMVLYFAGYQRHYAIYPATAQLVAALGDALGAALHNKATLRFPVPGDVPTKLITRIAKLRAAEAAALVTMKASKRNKKQSAKATPRAKPTKRKVSAQRGRGSAKTSDRRR